MGRVSRSIRRNGFRLPRTRNIGNKILRGITRWFLLCFVAAIFGYAISAFFFQTVHVTGPSMQPLLADSDVVLVNKLAPGLMKLKRFDVVAYKLVGTDQYYDIKCVVGLPGETLQISNGAIIVDGVEIKDTPWEERIQTAGLAETVVKLDKGEYFLLGYNVNNSEDSRFSSVGNVSKTEILGRVIYRISPKDKRGKIK